METNNTSLKRPETFITSGTRFGDSDALTMLHRPFATVEEMDAEIIRKWNERVSPEDTVWHLGDFGNFEKVKELNGKIKILLSDDDTMSILNKYAETSYEDFESICDNSEEVTDFVLTQLGFDTVYQEGEEVNDSIEDVGIPERFRIYTMSHEEPIDHKRFAVVGEYKGLMTKYEGCTLPAATDLWHFYPMNETELCFYFLGLDEVHSEIKNSNNN